MPAFQAAKGQRRAGGEPQGVDGGDGIGSEGDDVGIVAHLHPFLHELVDDAPPVNVAGEENQDIALLQFPHDGDGGLVGFGCPNDGGEAGHAPVYKLDAPAPQLDVVNGAIGIATLLSLFHVRAGETGAGQDQAGDALRLLPPGEADALDGLLSQEGGCAAVEGLAQIGKP